MRLRPIAPSELQPEQRTLYEDMRAGIEGSFKAFQAMNENGALIGPWNAWLHYPKYGAPAWALVKALSLSPTLPKPIREVAILVAGAKFRAAYEIYAHVRVAELGGLSDGKLATIVAGQRPVDLSQEESVAYDVASALVSGGSLAGTDVRAVGAYFRRSRYGRIDQPCRALLHGGRATEWVRRSCAGGTIAGTTPRCGTITKATDPIAGEGAR